MNTLFPLKFFPNLVTSTVPEFGRSTRTSTVLLRMSPTKLLGKREYVDPEFLKELGLSPNDHILGRYLFRLSAPMSQVAPNEHTLLPLQDFLSSYSESLPLFSLFLERIEISKMASDLVLPTRSFPYAVAYAGTGVLRFEQTEVHLSEEDFFVLPPNTPHVLLQGTLALVVHATEATQEAPAKLLSPTHKEYPDLLSTAFSFGSLTLLRNTVPISCVFPLPTEGALLFMEKGTLEVWKDNELIDFLYEEEERFFPSALGEVIFKTTSPAPSTFLTWSLHGTA